MMQLIIVLLVLFCFVRIFGAMFFTNLTTVQATAGEIESAILCLFNMLTPTLSFLLWILNMLLYFIILRWSEPDKEKAYAGSVGWAWKNVGDTYNKNEVLFMLSIIVWIAAVCSCFAMRMS